MQLGPVHSCWGRGGRRAELGQPVLRCVWPPERGTQPLCASPALETVLTSSSEARGSEGRQTREESGRGAVGVGP